MNKPTLTKEQAETIDLIKDRNRKTIGFPGSFIEEHAKYPGEWVDFAPINGMDLDTLIRSLYIGYTVEQTPEEKVRELYQEKLEQKYHAYNAGFSDGIKGTLNLLNIQIEGVNK